MPISLFVSNYTMTTAEDPDTITSDSFSVQTKNFTVSTTRIWFYLVNWDEVSTASADIIYSETLNFDYDRLPKLATYIVTSGLCLFGCILINYL